MSELRKDANATRRSMKKGIDASDARRRRTDTTVKLRKDKKTESYAKRRAMGSVATTTATSAPSDAMAVTDSTAAGVKGEYSVADIPSLMRVLQNSVASDEDILEAVRGFRRMLSKEKKPPVAEVLEIGAVPYFVQLLSKVTNEAIQFEAAWALTNVASTEHTEKVVDAEAVAPLVQLLVSPNSDVREQAAWCLGNIAGDSPTLRDKVLEAGAMMPLLQNISHPANDSLLGNAVWSLSNFCRGKPQADLKFVGHAVPYLDHLLMHPKQDVAMDACWALSYLSDGDDDRISVVVNAGSVPKLVNLLAHESSTVITPALRTLGNIVSGNDSHTQAVLDAGVLKYVMKLLNHPKRNIRKETCWLLSNIAAGTSDQIEALVSLPRELSTVISSIRTAEWEVRKESVWVVSNIATGGSDIHVQAIVELGAIDALCSMLTVADSKIIMVTMDAVEAILRVGQKLGKAFDVLVDEADGLEKIEGLQEHEQNDIYLKAVSIIEKYYGGDADEDENLAPAVNGNNTFAFGVQQKPFDPSSGLNEKQPMQTYNFS